MITANNLTPPVSTQPTAFESSAAAFGGAGDLYRSLGVEGSLSNINAYLNPYYEQVLNSAMGRLDTQKTAALNDIGDQALRSGAFGGSRHGVAEALTRSEFGRLATETDANLRAQGFDRAASMAQADKVASAAGLTQLGQDYFGVGNTIMGSQQQQGTMQQQLLQAILTGGAQGFEEYMQSPYKMIDLFNAIMASDPRRNSMQTTQQSSPGLFDFLSMGLQAWGGAG